MGEEYGVVTRNGSWYSYGEERLGQGIDNCQEYLEENEDLAKEIEEKIREEAGLEEHFTDSSEEEDEQEE